MKKSITVKLDSDLVDAIDELIAIGKYKSRSDVVKKALEYFISRELLLPVVSRTKAFESIIEE